MRRWFVLFLLALAQAPQSPRQALIEMLRATSHEAIDKHTPDALMQALAKLPPEKRKQQQQSMMFFSMAMAMAGNSLQTFETGPTFLVFENATQKTKVELTVERDDMTGDVDNMEFGLRMMKDGKPDDMPFEPHILVEMKIEKNVWKLTRIGASAGIQLDDPKVIAMIMDKAAQMPAVYSAQTPTTGNGIIVANNGPGSASAANAMAGLRMLATAEITYAASYPQVGYTCTLTDLGGSMSGKSPEEHAAQLVNPALAAGRRNGYRFELSGCAGTTSFRALATPVQKTPGHFNYCVDQTGVVRSAPDGEDCWAGKPVN